MNKQQIFELLSEVFQGFNVKILDKGTWCKIRVDDYLEVYTYSGYPDNSSIWYFSTFYDGHSKETQISEKDTREFVQNYYEIYKDLTTARNIYKSVSDRLSKISDVDNIRDRKITNIIDYDSQN